MKEKVLLVLAEIPYPATRNGYTLRYYPLIKELAQYIDVDLICLADGSGEVEHGDLTDYTNSITILRTSRAADSFLDKIKSLSCMFSPWGIPYRCYRHGAVKLAAQIIDVCESHYNAVLWVAPGLTEALKICRRSITADRWVMDMIDSPTLTESRTSGAKTIKGRLKLAKMRRWELDIISVCDLVVYISPRDRQEIEGYVVDADRKLAVIPNGIFIDNYSSEALTLRTPSIGFLGNMSYLPNVEAVHTLCRVHAQAKLRVPGLHLYIIGRDPLPEIKAYEADDISVTGTLDNIWPHVNGVDLFVLPMAMGAGQQNKMLEVMYAKKPIISSSVSNGGVCAIHGESILIADDEKSCVEQIVDMFGDLQQMKKIADGGADFVNQRYCWDKVGRDFNQKLVGTVA
ncbi:glycosyltransferase family 4 protein [Oceanicoccus sp. KOV_DT_Chl]|uniref:glycosyltransferase family 4 protein n=1 Tax=Oceanicoccus sp. KOV_DT_Chl TaxID=1904639 RepID=UPI000C7ADC8B|nr:glycosyltransferase family 4 protein [Oceanicoccus sp. KOV_DT_Chl]